MSFWICFKDVTDAKGDSLSFIGLIFSYGLISFFNLLVDLHNLEELIVSAFPEKVSAGLITLDLGSKGKVFWI